MNLLIASGDAVFARMLELECLSRGAAVTLVSERAALVDALPTARLSLIDAAFLREGALPAATGCDRIIIGYPDELLQIPLDELSKYDTVSRPFPVEDLMNAIFGRDDERVYEFRSRRKKSPSDHLMLEAEQHVAFYKGEKIALTAKEFALLRMLYENRGKAVGREEAATIFGEESAKTTNVVDVYVRYLRVKLDDRFHVRLITTVRGCGYMME